MLKWAKIEKTVWMVSMKIDKAAVIKDMPILNAILKYTATDPVAFHMPGHKLGKGFDIDEFKAIGKFDLTEIPGTDNLHFPEEAILEAQNLAARAFGADRTFFLVNGSTCGVHAAIMGTLSEGDKLIVSRDCHKSVIGGLMLARAVPVYVKPQMDLEFKIPLGCDVDAMIAAMDENPDAAGVFITRPTYYGICCDIERLVGEAHKRGMAVIVDEAHGAHFRFHDELPVSATDAGVDICIQSTHKTLPALTQTALLHVKGKLADPERIAFYLRLLETSSPSYIFLCAIDYARSLMEHSGQSLLEEIKNYVYEFEEELKENEYYRVGESLPAGYNKDFTRLVINTSRLGISGYEVEKLLRQEFNIQVEMSDFYNIVCILTVSDDRASLKKLSQALRKIAENFSKKEPLSDINIDEYTISSRNELIYGYAESELIPLNMAEGRVCADIITPYPPGIPYIAPGEIIMAETVELLYNIVNAGGHVNGLTSSGQIKVLTGD